MMETFALSQDPSQNQGVKMTSEYFMLLVISYFPTKVAL